MIEVNPTELLEPSKIYKSKLKDAFNDNANAYYDELVKKSGVNIEENRTIVKQYRKEYQAYEKILKRSKNQKGLRLFFILLTIGLIIGGIILIVTFGVNKGNAAIGYGVGIPLLVVAVLLFIYICVSLNKKIKHLDEQVEKANKKCEETKDRALKVLLPLYALFDWNMSLEVMNRTTPLLELDQAFDPEKYQKLHDLYGYKESQETDSSMMYIQSGSILGNPFVFEKTKIQTMEPHTYIGTLPITWTETVSTENGVKTVVRHQVLTATYIAPVPAYHTETWLIYGNGAAPDLSFSRQPTVKGMNEKALQRHVNGFEKTLDKMVAKGMKKGTGFTRLQNTKFEACFNALDRDNETQFRLLFTPLAQNNMVSLLTDNSEGYGDDFAFIKKKMLNLIYSAHMQEIGIIDMPPEYFMSFDYDEGRKSFIDYTNKYAKVIFFALAPLISIPLYQNYKAKDYIYKDTYPGNITQAEAESCANGWDKKHFTPKMSRSADIILKSSLLKKGKDSDLVNICAYAFSGTDRIELIPMLGGDGKMHMVPVPWVEYNQISEDSKMKITRVQKTLSDYNSEEDSNGLYQKRFVSYLEK